MQIECYCKFVMFLFTSVMESPIATSLAMQHYLGLAVCLIDFSSLRFTTLTI